MQQYSMKRVKESETSFRNKEKKKEERQQQDRGSTLKFLKSAGQLFSNIQHDQIETKIEREDIKCLTEERIPSIQ